MSLAEQLKERKRRESEWQKSHHLPVALVRADGDSRFYSGAVNSITCWADAGSVTWLGTRLGIKRVSKDSGAGPRHYIRGDGLPGEQVSAIVADERGAYALIDLGEQEALCAFEPAKDNWKTLETWPKEYNRIYFDGGKTRLSLGQDVVLAAPGFVSTKSDSPVFCFDRERHEARVLPWDAGVRADHSELQVGFLTCREKTALLGTNIGLIELPLSADGGQWIRRLENHYVTQGAEGSGRLYLWLALREAGYPSVPLKGHPRLYDPVIGQWEELPALPAQALPEATVDTDGALWLVGRQPSRSVSLTRPVNQAAVFWRWKSGDTAWTELNAEGKAVSTEPLQPVRPNGFYFLPAQYELAPIPNAEIIPDGPARLAASKATYNISDLEVIYSPFDSRRGNGLPATRWLKERFPYWISPEDPDVHTGAELFKHRGLKLALPDPKHPQKSWQGMGQGAIAAIDTRALQITLASAGSSPVNSAGATFMHLLPAEPLEQFSLPQENLALHARLHSMIPIHDGSYLALGEYPFHVSEDGRKWRELTPPPQERTATIHPLAPSDTFFSHGKNRILGTSRLEKTLLRFDFATGKLARTEIARPADGTFVGADDSGAWWYMRGNRLLFLAANSITWQERSIVPPSTAGIYSEPRLCGGRLWWYGYKSGGKYIGWDPRSDTWTSALELPQQPSNMRPIAEKNGDVLVASADYGINVWRWDSRKDTWTTITAMPWAGGEAAAVVAVAEDGIWVLDKKQKSLVRCDPRTKNQEQFPFPVLAQKSRDWDIRLWEDKRDFFLTGKEGLWRFDRRKRTWSEWKVSVTTTQLLPQVAVTNGDELWGFLNARNAGSAPLFRFEPSTRRFAFFDESSALPQFEDGFLAEAGGQIWLLHTTGAFRFDRAVQQFTCELPFKADRVAAAKDKSTVWISRELNLASPNHPTLYRWNSESGKVAPEKASLQNRCNALLSFENGVLIAANNGLFHADTTSVDWKRINTWGLSATQLQRDSRGAIWAVLGEQGYLHITTRSGL